MALAVFCAALAAGPSRADPFAQAMSDAAAGRHAQAAAGFHALAQDGDAIAAHNLAVLFALGQGVPRSKAEASFWAMHAFLSGLDEAAPLADLLLADLAVPDRTGLAQRLEENLTPAAAAGSADAMLGLAIVVALIRPEPDLLAAHAWQDIAAALDAPGAARARAETRARMSRDDLSRVEAHALEAFATWCAAAETGRPPSCGVMASMEAPPSPDMQAPGK